MLGSQVISHDAQGVFFQAGNLCLGDPYDLRDLHLCLAFKKTQ